MAVSKQAYTCAAPWIASQLANAFRDAFIDANLMTAWHDEWANGLGSGLVLHRVLRIVYDSSKKYGTVYHWFVFTADGTSYYSVAHQWDTLNHRPSGDVHLDYIKTDFGFSGIWSHRVFSINVLSTTVTLTRYTSSINDKVSMFLLKAGNSYFTFFFIPPGARTQPFVDINKNTCNGLIIPRISGTINVDTNIYGSEKLITFQHVCILKNSIWGYGIVSSAPIQEYSVRSTACGASYRGTGGGNGGFPGYTGDGGQINPDASLRNESTTSVQQFCTIALPAEKASANPNRSDDNTPVFTDLPFSMYFLDRLPLDFGIAWHYVNSTMEVQDIFQVTPGLEEWEILAVTNTSSTNNPSPLVLARVV